MAPRLVLSGLEYRLEGAQASLLRNVELDTDGHQRVGVVGPSGVGKTTLFELVAGRREPIKGTITFEGCAHSEAAIGYCYQDRRLVPWLTIRANIEYGLPEGRDPRLVDQMISRLELERSAGTLASQASGGEQARCAIGRALVSEPDVLLLDEPLSGLDGRVRDQVVRDLLALQEERRFLLVLISHELDDIEVLCEQMHVLAGSPAQIVKSVSLASMTAKAERAELIKNIASIIAE